MLATLGDTLDTSNNDGLNIAARNGHKSTVKTLAKLAVDINIPNKDDIAPFIMATHKGHLIYQNTC